MRSVRGLCKVQTADYCFHHANEYVTVIVPLYPKNNSPLSVCSLHFTLPPLLGKKAMNSLNVLSFDTKFKQI